jgi:hypothetical protein
VDRTAMPEVWAWLIDNNPCSQFISWPVGLPWSDSHQ